MHGDARRCNLVALFAVREELEAQLEERGAWRGNVGIPATGGANRGEEVDHRLLRVVRRELCVILGGDIMLVIGAQLRAAAQ